MSDADSWRIPMEVWLPSNHLKYNTHVYRHLRQAYTCRDREKVIHASSPDNSHRLDGLRETETADMLGQQTLNTTYYLGFTVGSAVTPDARTSADHQFSDTSNPSRLNSLAREQKNVYVCV
ncbi:hypothetical protein DPEC_G00202760 [Dallia pectoralis]|uniref:Uncharacterized protein n=1 Tax=Dallia pectoralis TaxID=75939 RepID=A0ACC2G905_DALPE|nr:hypothetical protein DPEC_G00202760 [Dallia pectoralis]